MLFVAPGAICPVERSRRYCALLFSLMLVT